jgi:hypothetical protein
MTKRAFVFSVPLPHSTTDDALSAAWEQCAAVGAALGWPHAPTETDVVRVGGGVHVPVEQLPEWVYWSVPSVIEDGPQKGSVVVVLDVDAPEIKALDKRSLAVPAEYAGRTTNGGALTLRASDAVDVTADLRGAAQIDATPADVLPIAKGKL